MTTGHGAPIPAKTRIANSMGKARVLMEALPYIQAFRGKSIVIKYGGSAMDDPSLRESFAGDVALLANVGIRTVVVHGGGPQISVAMAAEGIEPHFVDGLRVTDAATLAVVQRVLAGMVNPDIVRLLGGRGVRAVGVTGLDAGLFTASPRHPQLGFVGEVSRVDTALIEALEEQGMVPVVAPLGRADDGHVYNLNADTAAGALAVALAAQKLVFLTDVEGVYRDPAQPDSLISRMTGPELDELMASGTVGGGMLPKLRSVQEALGGGVHQAHILDGRIQHALLLEMFTPEGIGTMVTNE
jgi:acetylglutamate kinase